MGLKFKKVRMPISYQVVIFALLIFLGFMITNRVNQLIQTSDAKKIRNEKIAELKDKKDILLDEQTLLRSRSLLLSESLLALQNQRETELISAELMSSFEKTQRFAGLTEEVGSGVTIVLDDQSNASDVTDDPETILIHSQDIHYVIQTLVNSGASAIEVNGERITNLSCVTCVGPAIRINDRRYPAPFIIKAICDPDSTYDILINDAVVINRFEDYELIQIEKSTRLTISAFTNSEYVRRIFEELGASSEA